MLLHVRTIITSHDTTGAVGPAPDAAASPSGPFGPGRTSPARESIAQAADSLGSAFSVEELAAAVRARRPSTGVATVYRAVAAMEASGYLERVGDRAGTALFARCAASGHHHHHAVCTDCGTMVVTACPIGDAMDAARDAGFTVTGHEIKIYGLCRDCAAKPGGPEGPADGKA